jgi:hypothetical protein
MTSEAAFAGSPKQPRRSRGFWRALGYAPSLGARMRQRKNCVSLEPAQSGAAKVAVSRFALVRSAEHLSAVR